MYNITKTVAVKIGESDEFDIQSCASTPSFFPPLWSNYRILPGQPDIYFSEHEEIYKGESCFTGRLTRNSFSCVRMF